MHILVGYYIKSSAFNAIKLKDLNKKLKRHFRNLCSVTMFLFRPPSFYTTETESVFATALVNSNECIQVMEQSMTMSMFSSITPDEFNQEEDLYGKYIFSYLIQYNFELQ